MYLWYMLNWHVSACVHFNLNWYDGGHHHKFYCVVSVFAKKKINSLNNIIYVGMSLISFPLYFLLFLTSQRVTFSITFNTLDAIDCWKCATEIMNGLFWKQFNTLPYNFKWTETRHSIYSSFVITIDYDVNRFLLWHGYCQPMIDIIFILVWKRLFRWVEPYH